MKTQSLRDVGNKEIYDSYMGILRISPNIAGETLVDDTTTILQRLKAADGKDNKIILSDSDGNSLGIYFIPRVRQTMVINEVGGNEIQNVINVIVKSDTECFASNSYHIKSTLILNNTATATSVRPLQIFSKSQTTKDAVDVITYPIESPHTDNYFNSKNKLSLVDYTKSTPVHEQVENALKTKSKDWYTQNISSSEIVKINGEELFTTNDEGDQVPVLYTHDYVLGNYAGHSARVTEDIRSKFLGSSIALKQLKNNSSLYTKLSYIRLDQIVWERLAKILDGKERHTAGRYTRLGVGKNYSMTEYLFGIIAPNLSESAPILGTTVPFGGISYNAISFKRYLFNCLRQEIKNKKAIATATKKALDSNLQKMLNDGYITEAKQREKGFSAMLAKNYILCDGKEITPQNYPSINTNNPSLYIVNPGGVVQRDSNGQPILNTNDEVVQAIKNSCKGGKLTAPSLFSFELSSMRFLRGLNWVNSVGKSKPINLTSDIKAGILTDNNYNIEVVTDSDFGTTKKNLSSVGNYRTMCDFKLVSSTHKHFCFCSDNGEPIADGTDPMYGDKKLTTQLLEGKYLSVDTSNSLWTDLFTYSFSTNRSSVNDETLSQTTLYGFQPIRIAGKFAWRVKSDGSLTDNFESNVTGGRYHINDMSSTLVSADKNARKKQLLHINMAEAVAPISVTGSAGIKYMCTHKDFKCRQHIHWKHEGFTVCKNIGGYNLMQSKGGVKRCVTSLPMSLEQLTDVNYSNATKGTVLFSGKSITMDTSLPTPPAMSFIPLMKVA